MKALFFAILMTLGFSVTSVAQEKSTVAMGPTKTEIAAGKQSGNFTFILPEGVNADDVNQSAKYYTHYFTVEYSDKTRAAVLTMANNEEKSRSVIVRFLVANGVQKVSIDGTLVDINDLFEKYLK